MFVKTTASTMLETAERVATTPPVPATLSHCFSRAVQRRARSPTRDGVPQHYVNDLVANAFTTSTTEAAENVVSHADSP